MRILIANYEFPPVGGGASKVSYELAKALVAAGHEVVVLTSRYGDLPRHEIRDGISIHRVASWRHGIHDAGIRGAATFLLSALPKLRTLLKSARFDVVHFFFGLPTGLLSLYTHAVLKVPYIVSLRGSDVPRYDLNSRKLLILHRLTRPLSHRIWRNASSVFAVSDGLRDMAKESFPDVEVGVIHNGVDIIARSDYPAEINDDGRLRLICVSRLIPRKGISYLLRALASLPDLEYELTVIGAGPGKSDLEELARTLGIADKVDFVGYRPAEALNACYAKSDICVLPTLSDAFSNVILEAMAAALPVIATKVGGVPEAVIDGETGILIDPGSADQLSAAILELANDAARRQQLGAAGQRRASAEFTWAENARRYTEAYTRAARSIEKGD